MGNHATGLPTGNRDQGGAPLPRPSIIGTMAVYEYRCRACDARFEARRPMTESGSPIACPAGHADTTRVLSVFATVGASAPGARAPAPGAGGGCGAGCACAS